MGGHSKLNSGQALTEYVLLLSVLAATIVLLSRQMPKLLAKIEEPITKDFKYTYKYGDPKARGIDGDEGGPARHPRVYRQNNFKIFGPKKN